ncbi:hypothetical protein EDB85DRAFT_2139985 [Lactarius pseudohatsudake]|nr:hypothetical protein EDB85DRAFT_2139985 [Lactarius pseudohatsudake]
MTTVTSRLCNPAIDRERVKGPCPRKSTVLYMAVATASTEHNETCTPAQEVPVMAEISCAEAIYPCIGEQEDEFDVVVYVLSIPINPPDVNSGDTFVVVSRARGWWVVQRDHTGMDILDSDTGKQGWVPAGCLLETRIPIAKAEWVELRIHFSRLKHEYSNTSFSYHLDEHPRLCVDAIRSKRFNHRSFAVKEDGSYRGWAPSWYVGQMSSSSGTFATPNITASSTNDSATNTDGPFLAQHAQVSSEQLDE